MPNLISELKLLETSAIALVLFSSGNNTKHLGRSLEIRKAKLIVGSRVPSLLVDRAWENHYLIFKNLYIHDKGYLPYSSSLLGSDKCPSVFKWMRTWSLCIVLGVASQTLYTSNESNFRF